MPPTKSLCVPLLSFLTTGLLVTSGNGSAAGECAESSCLPDPSDNNNPKLCVGIRGNGKWIYSHYPSLARIVEEVGTIDGAAGGSSASVTTFVLESIQANPLVAAVDGAELCDMDRRARVSFLLKSVEAFDEQLSIVNPFTEAGEYGMEWLVESDILGRLARGGDVAKEAMADLQEFLGTMLRHVVNEEFLVLVNDLANNPDLQHMVVADILDSLLNNQLGTVDSPAYFVRPLPFDMGAASPIHDAIGSFYAGYEPVDMVGYEYMLEQCAVVGLGKAWKEVNETLADSGQSCGELFDELVANFIHARDIMAESDDGGGYPRRIDEPLGTATQTSLIAAAVIKDDGIGVYQNASLEYKSGNMNVTWDIDFGDIHYGYWGDDTALDKAREGITSFADLKSKKADFIGQTTWRDMLVRSPGEPGLSNGIPGTDSNGEDFISIGGWPDLVPTQVLLAVGCETVVLVSRNAGSGAFQDTVEATLGATEEQLAQLNDLASEASSWSMALALSSGSLCADYNNIDDKDDLTSTAWAGPFVTDNECLIGLFEDASSMLPMETEKAGCHHPSTQPSSEAGGGTDAESTGATSSASLKFATSLLVISITTLVVLVSFN